MAIDWSKNYWSENFSMSVDLATKHTNWLKFLAPLLIVILAVAGVSTQTQNLAVSPLAGIPTGIAAYLLLLMLFVTPTRIWRGVRESLEPKIEFIEHRDNSAFDSSNSTGYARVSVRNTSSEKALTNCFVRLASLDPTPKGFMTLNVPLNPMHQASEDYTFTLTPRGERTVNVLSKQDTDPRKHAILWHESY